MIPSTAQVVADLRTAQHELAAIDKELTESEDAELLDLRKEFAAMVARLSTILLNRATDNNSIQ